MGGGGDALSISPYLFSSLTDERVYGMERASSLPRIASVFCSSSIYPSPAGISFCLHTLTPSSPLIHSLVRVSSGSRREERPFLRCETSARLLTTRRELNGFRYPPCSLSFPPPFFPFWTNLRNESETISLLFSIPLPYSHSFPVKRLSWTANGRGNSAIGMEGAES